MSHGPLLAVILFGVVATLVSAMNGPRAAEPLRQSHIVSRSEHSMSGSLGHRNSFVYQLGRKALVGTLGILNSEVLFMNATPLDAVTGIGWLGLYYFPGFIVMDEIIQARSLDGVSVFLAGSIFGLWLEGILVATIPESPLFFTTYITTFWHGLLTTYAAFETTEVLMPRREPGSISPGWLWSGIGGMVLMGALVAPTTGPVVLEAWPTYAYSALLAGSFTWLVARRVRAGRPYQPRPLIAAGLVGAGFAMGLWHNSLDPEEIPYDAVQHLARTGIYIPVSTILAVAGLRPRD